MKNANGRECRLELKIPYEFVWLRRIWIAAAGRRGPWLAMESVIAFLALGMSRQSIKENFVLMEATYFGYVLQVDLFLWLREFLRIDDKWRITIYVKLLYFFLQSKLSLGMK